MNELQKQERKYALQGKDFTRNPAPQFSMLDRVALFTSALALTFSAGALLLAHLLHDLL